MRRLVFPALLFLTFNLNAHDIRLAYFEISRDSDHYNLIIRFDRDDILNELGAFGDLNEAFGRYIDGHLSLIFDGHKVRWQVNEIQLEDLFVIVDCEIAYNSDVKTINVWNTSLISSIDGHDNVVVLKLHNKNRSFRLNKQRQITVIRY